LGLFYSSNIMYISFRETTFKEGLKFSNIF
jgi:hypothetical protein